MKFKVDVLVYSFFVGWSILLGYLTYYIWRYGEVAVCEANALLINVEMAFAAAVFIFSVWAWVWLVTGKFRGAS